MTEFERLQVKALTSIAKSQEMIVAELTDIKTILKDMRREAECIEGHQSNISDAAFALNCLTEELEQCIAINYNRHGEGYKSFRVVPVE